jgi:DinB superfamily
MQNITGELLSYLDEQRSVLKAAFDSVPEELRNRPPAPERWSAANIAEHLSIVEGRISKILSDRIEESRTGLPAEARTEPILPTIDYKRVLDRSTRVKAPEVAIPTGLDASSAWTALENSGSMLRAILVKNDGVDLSSVTHPHPRFGVLSVYEWIAFLGAHEVRHAEQIREGNNVPSVPLTEGDSAARSARGGSGTPST